MSRCRQIGCANPASQHRFGRRARQLLEDARDGVAEILGADLFGPAPDRVLFTSGGTEANNLALLGLAAAAERIADGSHEAVISPIEHPSIAAAAQELERRGWHIRRLPVTREGVVDISALPDMITRRTRSISMMLGNNETGVLQPVAEAAAIASECGVPLHTDAVQVVGKLPVNFRALGVSTLSLAAHKFHGPVGIGALIVRGGTTLEPILWGGFQQAGLRPGTQPVALAVGLHAALAAWRREARERAHRFGTLRDRLERGLQAAYPDLVINGVGAPRLPHTSNVSLVGLDRRALAMAFDLAGVACSTGSACASGSSEPSPVLLAMGCDAEVVGSSIRFSLGVDTTIDEIDEAVRRAADVCQQLMRAKAATGRTAIQAR